MDNLITVRDINLLREENPKFFSFSLAIMVKIIKLGIEKIDAVEILKEPVISRSLEFLNLDMRNVFSEWFTNLSEQELMLIRNYAIHYLEDEDVIINEQAFLINTDEERKKMGAVFTPKWLANYVTKRAIYYWNENNKSSLERVGDLSCGPGIFLTQLQKYTGQNTKIYGVDSNPEYVFLASLLSGSEERAFLECADTLINLAPEEQCDLFSQVYQTPSKDYDIIVGNPPYVSSKTISSIYSNHIKELYGDYIEGNYDLSVPFIVHTYKALKDNGIGALIVSSKFMHSRYGKKICELLAKNTKILEIIDFGDGQVFKGKTTYVCVIIFSKQKPSIKHEIRVLKFPLGLKWGKRDTYFKNALEEKIPQIRLEKHPWDLSTGVYQSILYKIQSNQDLPSFNDIFPKITQGIRTGANDVFIISKEEKENFEEDILLPFIGGENIRRCRIEEPTKYLIYPYYLDNNKKVKLIDEHVLREYFPKTWAYLLKNKEKLIKGVKDNNVSWYGYSRSQNLDIHSYKKILVREMMPSAQFAADTEGTYSFGSGYSLIGGPELTETDYKMWAAILSTPTMEFQLRLIGTSLHSGWFRLLKQHLKQVKLVQLDAKDTGKAIKLAKKIHKNPDNNQFIEELDELVANAFGLSQEMREAIKKYLQQAHEVSEPRSKVSKKKNTIAHSVEENIDIVDETKYPELSNEQREKYLPVEITKYNSLHVEKPELRKLVTFQKNKEGIPIHNWYKYTQGFSADLIEYLLDEMGIKRNKETKVFDPFVGSGTTLLSCKYLGIHSFGVDISPLMTWIANIKIQNWKVNELEDLLNDLSKAQIAPISDPTLLFNDYLKKAYEPEILNQIVGWRKWIDNLQTSDLNKDFLLLGLISILEDISLIRKHGSHYRYLNKTENVGVSKLNIKTISSDTDIKPILLKKLTRMVSDIKELNLSTEVTCRAYNMNSRFNVPRDEKANVVITSPPYLNRNNYLSQQKAELSILGLLKSESDYKELVKKSYRSHVEAELDKEAKCSIPEVNKIIEKIDLSDNNNPKIPNMVAGYFEDLKSTLMNIRTLLEPEAKLAFVVGNSRWGGVVVPVDHLLGLIAERLGYNVEKILVARYKGNSPQQMKKYGKIPVRESVVILSWKG